MELNDFKQEQPITVADFGKLPPTGPTVNEKSAAQIAATLSVLQGGDPAVYEQNKKDLLDPASRDQFIQKQRQLRDHLWEDAQHALPSLFADPSVSDETKMGVAGSVWPPSTITSFKLPPLNTIETLAQEAAVADSGVNETERAAQSRNLAIDNISEIVKQKRQIATAINGLHIGEQSGAVKKLKDIGELIVPFVELLRYDNLSAENNPDYTPGLLGQKKQEFYDQMQKVPVADRALFAERMMDYISANSSILFPDGNDVVAYNDLHRLLLEEDYSNTERWMDNISTILDVAGVGGFARLLRGTGKAITASGKAAEVASATSKGMTLQEEATAFSEAQRAAESAPNALATEAKNFKPSAEPTVDSVFPKPIKNTEKSMAEEAKNFKPSPEPKADEIFRQAVSESARTEVPPTAPSQTVKDFNPELARQLHTITAQDDTGEAAKALYGTTKTEAMAKDLLPEPDITPGKMANKVEMNKGPEFPEPEAIRKARNANGNTIVSNSELKVLKEKLTSGLQNIEGMLLHPSSMLVRLNKDATIGFTARYSPVDSGFATAQEAIDNAKYAFRHYGLQDENFTLLERKGADWVEISVKDAKAKDALKTLSPQTVKDNPALNNIDYAIGMKYDYKFNPDDWTEAELLSTAPGLIARSVQFLDRMPSQFLAQLGQGSIVQHLLDNAALIHPQIVNASSVAIDRVFGLKKLYVQEFDDFTKTYAKMTKERRAAMTDYIHQANLEGLKLDEVDLYKRGFSEDEVKALKQWRRANDYLWYAANADMGITLRSKGFQAFVHDASGTKLYGRPMAAQTAYAEKYIFDPVANKVVQMERAQIEALYEKGGTAFRLGEPTKIDGHWVDTVISPNTPTGGYLRRIYEGEKVLAYRDGYYPVAYDANYFIQKVVRKADGTEGYKVIASAKNSNEVKSLLAKLQADDPESTFTFKTDRALRQRSSHLFDEGSWNLSSNSSVTSQRIRGERLGDDSVDLNKMGNAHLKDPLHTVQAQVQQLSQRTAVRPYLDAVKKRWMLNYSKYIEIPVNPKTGRVEMPTSIADIKGKPGAPEALVADARTNFNYISSLENGYINLIDDGYKAVTQVFARFLGEKGFSMGEEALFSASKMNPSQIARTVAFKLFISASPARQAMVQRGQMLQIGAVNPTYFAKNMVKDWGMIDLVRNGLSKDPKYVALWDEIKDAGVMEAVDAHLLMRDNMLNMADMSTGHKVLKAIDAPFRLGQKVGFDAAEQDVLLTSWLAHRDLALKAGKDITNQRVKDEILGQARAFTLNMNRSGDMPYTQNTLSVMAQFFSFKHKALLQGLTNRSLSKTDRLKVLAYTAAVFGIDATPLAAIYALLPESEPTETKQAIKDGFLSIALNEALTLATGTDQAIDWGDMAPTEAGGLGTTFVSMLDTPISAIVAGGPSSSLLFGGNPRLTDAFKTGMRYFNVIDDYGDENLQTNFTDVVKATASMTSGFSSFFKAQYAMKTGQKMSSSGRISDSEVTGTEAFMAALGFRTKTETGYQDVRDIQFKDKTFEETDVQNWYGELKRHLARRGDRVDDIDMQQRVLAESWRVFGEDRPRALEVIKKELSKDAQDGDFVVFKGLLNQMGLATNEEVWQMINALPDSPGKDNLVDIMNKREEQANGN